MAMVSSSRPSLRSTSGRFIRKPSPNPPEPHVTALSTRSNKFPLRPAFDTATTHQLPQNHADTPSTDAQPRKETRGHPHPSPAATSAAEIPDHKTPRPPTKIIVAQPNGELLQTTNDVQRRLNATENGIASQASTPRPDTVNGAKNGKTPVEARSLRSKDVGSRLKSELSKFFPEYDDVMNDVPESPGMSPAVRCWAVIRVLTRRRIPETRRTHPNHERSAKAHSFKTKSTPAKWPKVYRDACQKRR
jgi:hypothetical protein